MFGECLFLGTGSSVGVPVVGCRCAVCHSSDPRNQRMRSSAIIEINGKKLLVDTGPDLRMQLLRAQISDIDGVVLTHAHADHINGIDDLRPFYFLKHQPMPLLLSKETLAEVSQRFPYLFEESASAPLIVPQVLPQDMGKVSFCGVEIDYVSYIQLGMKVTGVRIGKFAFITDIRGYDEAILDSLRGIEILVVSALRGNPSPAHFSIEEAIVFSEKIKTEKTFFTHIAHDIEHARTQKALPEGYFLAYDGLKVPFSL